MANSARIVPRSGGASAKSGTSKAEAAARRIGKLIRVAGKAPEVMVKVTGRNQSVAGVRAHLAYLGRDDDAHAELDNGQRLYGREVIASTAVLFDEPMLQGGGRDNGDIAVHIVFSMPKGTPTERVLEAVRETSREAFDGHQYVLVQHTDKGHPHVHAVVSARDERGRKLRHFKPQLQAWREAFATKLRQQGVLAEATSRELRGVVQKSVSRPIRAIRDQRGQQLASGQVPRPLARSDASKLQEVLREMVAERSGEGKSTGPWEDAVRRKRERVEEGWRRAHRLLLEEGGPGTKEGARAIAGFIASIPPVVYERDRIKGVLRGKAMELAMANSNDEPGSRVDRKRSNTGGANGSPDPERSPEHGPERRRR